MTADSDKIFAHILSTVLPHLVHRSVHRISARAFERDGSGDLEGGVGGVGRIAEVSAPVIVVGGGASAVWLDRRRRRRDGTELSRENE